MKLNQWALREHLTYLDVAAMIGRSPSVVYKWFVGTSRPNEDGMAALYQLTLGQVTPTDFYELPLLPRLRALRRRRRRAAPQGCAA